MHVHTFLVLNPEILILYLLKFIWMKVGTPRYPSDQRLTETRWSLHRERVNIYSSKGDTLLSTLALIMCK